MSTANRRTPSFRAAVTIGLLACSVVLTPLRAGQSSAKPPLVVLGNDDFAPLSYLERGEPKGLDVDVARAVAAAMGRGLRVELMDWGLARERVLRGEADALMDLSVGDERSAQWDFTEEIFERQFTLFVRRDEVAIRGVDDLDGRRVGAARGGLAFEFLQARGGITLVSFSNYAEALSLLQTEKVDAVAGDQWVLAHAIQRRVISGITAAGEPFLVRPTGFGLRKGNNALVDEMNQAIAALRADGTLARIADRWRPQEVVFLSRERIQRDRAWYLGIGSLIAVAGLALWVVTLKRHLRVRKAGEAALRESRERLSFALSSAEMGTWRWTASTGTAVRDASLSAMLGHEPVEWTGRWQEWFSHVHADDRASTQDRFERSIRDHAPFSTEFRIVKPDGSVRWVDARGRPFFDDSGTLAHVTGTVVDVTERRLAEDALRASEEKFFKAFNASPDCIALQDFDAQLFLEVNDRFEQYTGYRRDELIGRNLLQLGMIIDLAQREALVAGLQDTGSVRDLHMPLRCKNGDVLTALISAEVMTLGGRRCVLYVARDVTRQTHLEAQLRQASDINRLFVSELDPKALYAEVTQSISQVVAADYASLVLYDGSGQLQVPAQTFYDGRGVLLSGQTVAAGGTLARATLAQGDVTVFSANDLASFDESVAPLVREGLRTVCCVPLVGRRGPLGVLEVGSRHDEAFNPNDIEIMRQLSTYIGIAVENALTYEEVTRLKNHLAEEKLYLEEEIRVAHDFRDVVGASPALRRVLQAVETVAPTESTVLILGETGTGKELFARAIHELSPRKDRTFVRVNAAALPASLLESELFGYERGAFTGAVSAKVGRFELAHRGTLFLDEVGDIPLELQAKLLRVLQEREFERLGATRTQHVDVRVIAATNRDLEEMVIAGTFRSDLYYRLNVFPVRVPPLRERPEDIPMLVRHFVKRFSARLKRQIDTIPASTMSALQRWSWPGNVRELENVIERAVILSTGSVLQVPLADLTLAAESPPPRAAPMVTTLADAERETILRALREAKGVVAGESGAAARLGMKRTTLQSKMRKLGIRRPSF
jgi:formate hydrogenlyase transcriptional activator